MPTDKERLDALLFDERLDLRRREEDGKWAAFNLETEDGVGPFETPREAIDAFLRASKPKKARGGRGA